MSNRFLRLYRDVVRAIKAANDAFLATSDQNQYIAAHAKVVKIEQEVNNLRNKGLQVEKNKIIHNQLLNASIDKNKKLRNLIIYLESM